MLWAAVLSSGRGLAERLAVDAGSLACALLLSLSFPDLVVVIYASTAQDERARAHSRARTRCLRLIGASLRPCSEIRQGNRYRKLLKKTITPGDTSDPVRRCSLAETRTREGAKRATQRWNCLTLSPPRDDVLHRVLLVSADRHSWAASTSTLLCHAVVTSVGGKLAANAASATLSSVETEVLRAEFRRLPFSAWSQHTRARHR